ncbi:MarR family winged helix-turn-helix transcriptional regulator [Cytobacillus gottheilii]|uniref:MarR family transcriptional regulator n=1 Tax=Cytobacillus gottheilii TaxID=859144 RepID=A0ABX8FF49_9BACI|nr:MarR family transcriptional regulator [Cytobacillus gottheilii]QVY62658.1 MarR family transcriptional regulator [Cytobacillus gottheilii]
MCIYTFNEDGDLLQEEKDTISQLSKIPLDSLNLNAVSVVTNIYRVAQGLKNEMEREVLSKHGLSWTSFSILYDLWIWKSVETKKLAELNAVSKATISNITKTLEKKEYCYRKTDPRDRRITFLAITEQGKKVIEELYPQFHQGEVKIASSLSEDEQKTAAELLRRMIRDNQY